MNYIGSPKHLENLKEARKKARQTKESCPTCGGLFTKSGLSNHTKFCKPCPVCGKFFSSKSKTTCSYSCANTYFRSGENHPNYKFVKDYTEAENSPYRKICFSHHKKECVVCGESKLVEVHHYDEDKENNSPSNLVPLCPTHHQYWHSRFKSEVQSIVDRYVKNFRDEEAGSSTGFGG